MTVSGVKSASFIVKSSSSTGVPSARMRLRSSSGTLRKPSSTMPVVTRLISTYEGFRLSSSRHSGESSGAKLDSKYACAPGDDSSVGDKAKAYRRTKRCFTYRAERGSKFPSPTTPTRERALRETPSEMLGTNVGSRWENRIACVQRECADAAAAAAWCAGCGLWKTARDVRVAGTFRNEPDTQAYSGY
eukprot:scaffold572_cov229-Amphora_coffeaeformis.AAC.15